MAKCPRCFSSRPHVRCAIITKPIPVTTLAQLRKLAKRKGCDYTELEYVHCFQAGISFTNRDKDSDSGGFWFNAWSTQLPVREVAFAALSALPDTDAPKGGSK